MYYIQYCKQYSGNCVMWWKAGANGYTSNLDKAGVFTAEEIKKLNIREGVDIIWHKTSLDNRIQRTVDMQYLPRSEAIKRF